MKIHLFDIEALINSQLLLEAQELVRDTREYDIKRIEDDYYHCISRQPEYHVEIRLNDERQASPKCHCAVFKRTKECKHVVAALILLREYIQRGRKARKKSDLEAVDDVLKKLNITELRSFISSYALSHSALKAEILSNYLYLTRKPDYHSLYNAVAPVDKFGQLKLNRNNLKTIRAISSTLLKRAQLLLRDKALSETLWILEAVLFQLHKMWTKGTAYQDQIMVELRMAYKLFEVLCHQSMAPRLQVPAIRMAIDICEKDKYQFPKGQKPLLQLTEDFILEEKLRGEVLEIAAQKISDQNTQRIRWASLLVHWARIWGKTKYQAKVKPDLPEIITEWHQENAHEDVIFAYSIIDLKNLPDTTAYAILKMALKAARLTNQMELHNQYAYALALQYLDMDAFDALYEFNATDAVRVLSKLEDLHSPGMDEATDTFLLHGWRIAGNAKSMITRLESLKDIDRVMEYDQFLKDQDPAAVSRLYARHIIDIKDTYGGVMARQKLNNIFSHLKSTGLADSVAATIKQTEKTKTEPMDDSQPVIRGFVFDLDGVIVDTAVHHFRAWKKILKELGADITEEDDHHTKGAGRMESLEYLIGQYGIQLTEEQKLYWASRKNDAYVYSIQHITPDDLLPGALTFLEASRREGLSLALGSASKNAKPVLEKLGIADRFDAILDGNDTQASKPDPEIFLKAASALGLDPASVVVFEDAVKGVQAALSAGCKVVGIGDRSTLSAAHVVVPNLENIEPHQIIEQVV